MRTKMNDLVEAFETQLKQAIDIAERYDFKIISDIQNVFISGLGGSGIGASIAKQIADLQTNIPIEVSKGYFIPAYVNQKTLAIFSSYSGNTEETLSALKFALQRNAHIICITSGGEIENLAKQNNLSLIKLPAGFPPRACLGYSLTQLLHIFYKYALIKENPLIEISSAATLLKKEKDNIKNEAQKIAQKIHDKIPVIYTTTYNEALAIRVRQQLNENAKMLCWHHFIPEMNHNELVGWREKNDKLAVLFLLDDADYDRNKKRIEIVQEVCSKYTPHILNLSSKGKTKIEKTLYLIHLTDYLSCYLADIRGFDAMEIEVINYLKSELSKF